LEAGPTFAASFLRACIASIAPLRELAYLARSIYISAVLHRFIVIALFLLLPAFAEKPDAQLLVGDSLPDAPFLDAKAKPWKWSDLRGRPVAFTFVFTRCPMPEFCPRLTEKFREANQLLQKAPIAAGWQFVSLTIDPAFDTPAVLAAYATAQRADPTHWRFATAEAAVIAQLAGAFGAGRVGEMPTHNLRTVVVGADGRIRKIFVGNEWHPAELVEEMRRVAVSTSR